MNILMMPNPCIFRVGGLAPDNGPAFRAGAARPLTDRDAMKRQALLQTERFSMAGSARNLLAVFWKFCRSKRHYREEGTEFWKFATEQFLVEGALLWNVAGPTVSSIQEGDGQQGQQGKRERRSC